MDGTVIFEAMETFGVPNRIVDMYLKAPAAELRLILFLLRNKNSSFAKQDIIAALGEDEERIDKAFKYWCAAGILFKTGNKYIFERPKINAADIIHYSADEIASRIDTDESIRFLYKTAEDSLARPLTTTDASAIISLVDWNGLPPDVAALLINYGASEGRGLARIQKMGIEWAEKGIDSFEKAESYISARQASNDAIQKTSRLLGLTHRALTDAEKKAFGKWASEYGYGTDVIKLAYDRTVANTGKYSYRYMDKILNSWFEAGLKSQSEILNYEQNAETEQKSRKPRKKRNDTRIDRRELDESIQDSWAIIEAEVNMGEK